MNSGPSTPFFESLRVCGRGMWTSRATLTQTAWRDRTQLLLSPSLSREDEYTNLTATPPLLIKLGIMGGSGSLPPVRANEPIPRPNSRTLPQWPLSIPISNAHRDRDALPFPHPTPPRNHRSECDRRVEEVKHAYGLLLTEKDVRIGELKNKKGTQIEELKRERGVRLEELAREKESRIEEVKRERDERIEELKREKDARIEELKRDREVAIKNMEEQLERSRREVLQLREENNRLKDEITRLKVQLGQEGRCGT